MSRLIYSMSVSLDGFVETPDHSLDWVIVDEELHTFFNEQARAMDAFLFGRRMYELMAASWPTVDAQRADPGYMLEYARIWKEKPKVVFSKSLTKVEWNSRLVKGDLAQEVASMKARPGKDFSIGGPTVAAGLVRLGLIDEYQLFLNPVILGSGTPYFPSMDRPLRLRRIESRRFGSGVVFLRYQPDREERK